jgi:hypothetical protein
MKKTEKDQLEQMTYVQADDLLMNKVFEVTILFEQLEKAGKVHGNSDDMRQRVSYAAKRVLKEQWIK